MPNARYNENLQLLQDPKVQASLAMIRKGEGTFDQGGYKRKFGGGEFDSFSDHPRDVVSADGYRSSAAGAYQFMPDTWDETRKALGINDFSPLSQDIAAVELMRRRGMMPYIESGDVRGFLNKAAPTWASMPKYDGNSYHKQRVVAQAKLQQVYDDYMDGTKKPMFAGVDGSVEVGFTVADAAKATKTRSGSGGEAVQVAGVSGGGSYDAALAENINKLTVEQRMALLSGATNPYLAG
jgi:muramidase (phage lysozyme)